MPLDAWRVAPAVTTCIFVRPHEDFYDRVFLVVHGWHNTDVHAVFVEASRHAFGGEDVFAVVDFVLASLRPSVGASPCADSPNILHVHL